MSKVAVIAGVGPGLGESIARKFAAEGCSVGLFARSIDYLNDLAEDIRKSGGQTLPVQVDLTNQKDIRQGFEEVKQELGAVNILVNHASAANWKGLLDTTPDEFENAWRVTTFSGFLCSREVVPSMLERNEGTILFTGATSSVRGAAGSIGFASGKFGMRGIVQSMARELGPRGIHVAHIIIDGQIDTPRVRKMFTGREDDTFLNPDQIAENYWHLVNQDKTTWTLELDLRPYVEEF